ncbi:hypothetical protein [Streptomyces sp. NPDC048172]|uniref:hypothetical protein n=1 Tax=Streptomyces sp. NPDC048172 TaxID=3365505 RepID=UPI00370FF2A1
MQADSGTPQEPTTTRRSTTGRVLAMGALYGLPAGLVLGLMVFDNLAVGLIMGFAIGTVGSIAFVSSRSDG